MGIENEIHIVNIACWLQLMYMRVIQSNITNITPQKKFKGGGGDPPLFAVHNPPDFVCRNLPYDVVSASPRYMSTKHKVKN